jgi:macrolide transport system ATP-binding/permease protein
MPRVVASPLRGVNASPVRRQEPCRSPKAGGVLPNNGPSTCVYIVGMMVWLEHVWQDLRHGSRMLGRSPGFATVAVLSLAIGIGVNCAIFSFADALLLRPLPVARPGEVVTVGTTETLEAIGVSTLASSYRDYVDIRDHSRSFQGLAAFTYVTAGFAIRPDDTPRLKMGMLVSGNLFAVMGVGPARGRLFTRDENQVPGRDAVVVLGHASWEQDFGADPGVLGRRVDINGHPFTVVGVAPREFSGLNPYLRAAFFAPLMMSPQLIRDPQAASLEARGARNLTLKGRLAPGVSQADAQAELTTLGANLARAYPDTNKNQRLQIRTELQARIAQSPPDATLVAMLATLALAVLVVACANVAGLLTSRAPVRAREMAMRMAIGAGRWRLIRQLITESLLLALAGGGAGLGIGYAGMTLFRQIELPTDLPVLISFRMDHRALLFSLAVAVVSAVLFGLSPAVQATRADLTAVIKTGDTAAPRRRRRWGRALLVAGQVAVSVVLLAVALFMYRGFGQQLATGPGYRTDHLLTMAFDTSLAGYTDAQAQRFFEEVADRAREVPGVAGVTMASSVPMANDGVGVESVIPEGFRFPPGKESANVLAARVDEYYFETLGLTILRGRAFRAEDAVGAPEGAIVNEQFARQYWPNADPIGRRFRLADRDGTWVQVVGLAKTSKYLFIAEPPTQFIYLPYRQERVGRMVMFAQSRGDPASLAAPLRELVHRLDPNLPVYNVRTMAEVYEMRATRIFRVLFTTVGAMGLMGLGLALVGLYGLVAYAANRRTREIGIRMAIGADSQAVLRLILRQGVVLAAAGLVVGLAASVGAGALLAAAFPSGEDQRDLWALVVVVPVVLAVTFLAAYIPARRASRVSPMLALRNE